MALTGKLEADVELKAPADKFFNIIRSETHQIPNAASDKVHNVEVHEGDWEADGSVKLWKYTVEGKDEIFKEKITVDEANKSVTLVALEAHVMEEFKSYKIVFGVTPMSDQSSVVKITLDYEKLNENIPDPNQYLQFLMNVIKDIDAHLLKA
ncbi:PREDICTED: MLP-like protein 328 [Theobroma cacao]|uniref:MLP-like protein 328 n=1 Tax=Theobroma cacao TaxID=3641 RepID=A0AB32VXY4_THECC|nr:PREDICTED: MLP-like protein 328 [Theobroma cacao]